MPDDGSGSNLKIWQLYIVLWSSTLSAVSSDFCFITLSMLSIQLMFQAKRWVRYSGKRILCISIRNCFNFSMACLISNMVVRCLTRANPKLYCAFTSTIYRSNRYFSIGSWEFARAWGFDSAIFNCLRWLCSISVDFGVGQQICKLNWLLVQME